MAFVLETVSADAYASGDATPEPIWLQDASSQTCLGPQGKFTPDCGDATLWLAVRQSLQQPRQERKRFKRKRARMGLLGVEEEGEKAVAQRQEHPSHGLVFYLVDRDVQEIIDLTTEPRSSGAWWNPKQWLQGLSRRKQFQKRKAGSVAPLECLVHDTDGNVSVQQCDHGKHRIPEISALPTWGWKVETEQNQRLRPTQVRTAAPQSPKKGETREDETCAMIGGVSNRIQLSTCMQDSATTDAGQSLLQLQLSIVRYRAVSVPEATQHSLDNAKSANQLPPSSTDENSEIVDEHHDDTSGPQSQEEVAPRTTSATTSIRDLAHRAAFASSMHPTLPPRLLFEQRRNSPEKKSETESRPKLRGLHNTNPILLAGNSSSRLRSKVDTQQRSSLAQALEGGTVGSSGRDNPSALPRFIPVHPYIADAKNEVWTDPQTGLQYPTDLSGYLGHDRKERGRQTLMGVGQYRKGYVIKVYGIAYFVSKRDVLADPFFEAYAEMSAAELQNRVEFYEHLRLHPENFERTIFIQTNMQLSAETIRGSLKADWSMLTDEAKDTILESSMKPQPMDERTKALLNDPNNPGRCSCMAMAPPELDADPSCCARGTELVFTWLKNGDIECRLNGRIVEVFPRPDIAQGIFFEYLRYDDPISPELREHIVDGFPFLLAPLRQMKGVHMAQSSPSSTKEGTGVNPLLRVFAELSDAVGSHAVGLVGSFQKAAAETGSHFQRVGADSAKAMVDSFRTLGDAARNFGDSVQDLGREMNRRREDTAKRVASFPEAAARLRESPINTLKEWLSKVQDRDATGSTKDLTVEEEDQFHQLRLPSNGRLFGYPLSRWFGDVYYTPAPDEIGPMIINPTMDMTRKAFLFLVHLYLLLLFIVSFPGSYTTRTKLIRKNSKGRGAVSDTESDSEVDDDSYAENDNRTDCLQAKNFFSPRLVRGSKTVLPSKASSQNKLRE
eukprot:CAMPEP_0168747022 /NCGR_PEP_ID=MMETSP0724-20121128/15449_1 /TAXON_ID=265536 /ORGANISM="Amphiprora sp., Strain CCMP467" /LENGTH=953 /DNA_ID=CAMNT_0008794813 /DNA_START=408 /DNA_END=3270 /DNA_ORIENTATION=+